MKQLVIFMLIGFLGLSSMQAQDTASAKKEGYQFTDVKVIPHTSIKNQYRSGTCWSFSGTAFFEAEMMREGKPATNLSPMFSVWHSYLDKAKKYVRLHGALNFGGGGAFNDVQNVIREYGMIPDTIYPGINYDELKHVHYELDAMLLSMAKTIIKDPNKKLTPVWPLAFASVLNTYLGEIPEEFLYNNKTYTPRSFADEYMGLNMDDYIMLTSYTHHPFYEPFVLEVPDNWAWGLVYNIPLDELMQTINNAINNGYTVAWAADVSERGFNWRKGVAVVPEDDEAKMNDTEQSKWEKLDAKERRKVLYAFDGPRTEKLITQEMRQKAFDNYRTTDDHGMLLVGSATDQAGNHYFKVKNSWGTDQVYKGYFYASDAFVADKTMSIMINKKAIPKAILKKMQL